MTITEFIAVRAGIGIPGIMLAGILMYILWRFSLVRRTAMGVSEFIGFSVIAIVGVETLYIFWRFGMGFQLMISGMLFFITVLAMGSMLYIFWDVPDDWPHNDD